MRILNSIRIFKRIPRPYNCDHYYAEWEPGGRGGDLFIDRTSTSFTNGRSESGFNIHDCEKSGIYDYKDLPYKENWIVL